MNEEKQKIVYSADGVEFTIYKTSKPTRSGPKVYWLLEDYSTGKRRLLNNLTKKAAQQRADSIRAAMVKGQASRLAISNSAWQDVVVAREIVRSLGTNDSVTTAVREWSECRAMLGNRASLLDATKFFLSNHKNGGPPFKPTSFAEAASQYHQFKVSAGKSKGHCRNIKCQIDRLANALPANVRLDEFTPGQLDGVVLSFGLKGKSCNEYRMMLSNFFAWAAKQNPPMVSKGFNPAKDMERHKVRHEEVEFLRVQDLRRILTTAPEKRPDLLPLIVLVCFGGLRPSEVVRLDWSEVGVDHIRIPGKKSKTGYSRQIPLPENLKAWLALWRMNAGPICPGIGLSHINAAIRHFSGVRLAHDALRHSFGTYRQKLVKNVAQVAEEMGNSAQICHRHYLNSFCTEEEAKAWFSIMPTGPANVIAMPNAAEAPSAAVDGVGG